MTNIQNFKLPTSWRGRDGKKDYEDVIGGKYDKKPETPIPVQTNKFDTNDFIYVPSINLYVAKEKTNLSHNWENCWIRLQRHDYQMLKINEFREFLKYLKSNPTNEEYKNIFKEITGVKNPLRSEWLDASFKNENKEIYKKIELYILTENESKKEKLEECLMLNKSVTELYYSINKENLRRSFISLNDWINGKNVTSQGLPNKNISSGGLNYWCPKENNNSVARFIAHGGGTDLDCGYEKLECASEVRPCKARLAGGIK